MSTSRFLVSRVECADDHVHTAACRYRVVSKINPHMKVGAVDFQRARSQHRDFVSALRFCGAQVELLPFVHGCPDSVFMKDNALVVDGPAGPRALLAAPRHVERGGEQEPRRRQLQHLHYQVQRCGVGTFEGGDVVVAERGAFFGVGDRSSSGAASVVSSFLQRPVQTLELIDPAFFHLDTCFGLLTDGTALVAEGALSSTSMAQLRRHPVIRNVVMIPRDDALQFGLNFVQVGDAVILHAGAKETARVLRLMGKVPVTVDLSEFLLSGGSAACLVARVHAQRVVFEDAVAA